MKKLLVYLNEYKKECVLSPLFKLLEVLFELTVPLVVASMIDVGIAGANRRYVLFMGLALAGLAVGGMAVAITAQYFAAKAAVGSASRLRHALFDHLQHLSYAQLDALGTSTMITRLTSDVNQFQTGINMGLRLLLRSPFVVFGAMLMAFTIDRQAALIFLGVIALLFVVVGVIMGVTIPLYRTVQQKLDRVLGATRENLTGVRPIRAFCKENDEIEAFSRRNSELEQMQQHVGRISALMNPLTYVLLNAAILVLIYTGALRVQSGLLSQGAVVALYNYMSQILVELIKLANLIITLTKSVASAGRISKVFDVLPDQQTPHTPIPAEKMASDIMVEFDHVSLTYPGAGGESLSDISFCAKAGEVIGVIGSTGSGKTSLVNLIPRFYDATAGTVRVCGVNVSDYPMDQLREKIGVVPQRAVLFQGTIRENILWGNPHATLPQIQSAIQTAQAEDVVTSKSEGLDAPIEQGGRNLSGGQRQRLTIARALVREPEILILDDSASALDYATDSRLRAAIARMPGRPTVFIVSQRTASIRNADQILVLDDGRLAGKGTHEQLLETCPIYREIYESQFQKEAV